MTLKDKLQRLARLDLYEASVAQTDGATFFLARRGAEKVAGAIGASDLAGDRVGEIDSRCVVVGPTSHANAEIVRRRLPWTAPVCIGPKTSVGLGDRLGLATPGHVRAVRGTGVACVLAQQSIREMTRTGRSPQQVMDDATWGVLQEGFKQGFGADADHLKTTEDIDATMAAGFVMFTIDPGDHVDNEADTLGAGELNDRFEALPWDRLEASGKDQIALYAGRTIDVDLLGRTFDQGALVRAAVKYGCAVAHSAAMAGHIRRRAGERAVEIEISVDETESPTSALEHYYIAAELKRLGVEWAALAPRFVGRFEKGVEYIGDLGQFEACFAEHCRVAECFGGYKMSIHSGSDKFSIYEICARHAAGRIHLKTAGTSYLEAIRTIAAVEETLFREILEFARSRYETDRRSYHVSAELAKVPRPDQCAAMSADELLNQFDTRQVLHVTFGAVLQAQGGRRFKKRLLTALEAHEELHYQNLCTHLGRHVAPLVR